MLNVVTIYAARKTSSLPNTLKTMLLNLVVTDNGVGLLFNQFTPQFTSPLAKLLMFSTPGGVLPEKLGVGVGTASQNPYPIYDQNL